MYALTVPERFARRLLMDFGFGSLVDKFEERLGRRATSALLWIAAVALLVVCVRTIINEGVTPLVAFIRGISSQSVLGVISSVLLGAVVAAVFAMVFVALVRWLIKRSVTSIVERAQEHVRRAERTVANAEAFAAEVSERLDKAISAEERALGLIEKVAQAPPPKRNKPRTKPLPESRIGRSKSE